MKREDFRDHFGLLEVDITASFKDVRQAYHQLRDLYTGNSMVLSPVEDELDEGSREKLIEQIDHAYKELCFYFNEKESPENQPSETHPGQEKLEVSGAFSGPVLKEIREAADVRLSDISLATRIRIEYLENIEKENYGALPPPVFLRGYVASYATYLSLDPVTVTRDYMAGYDNSR